MAKRILFQGDSITDSGRRKDNFYSVGSGYASLVKGSLGLDHPGEYEFLNRGKGGDRIVDIYARIKTDFINLQPDYASIFVGVNDAGKDINECDGVDDEKFEKIYTLLIDEVLEACPNIKLMLIAPFLVQGDWDYSKEDYVLFLQGVANKAAIVKKLAEKYSLPLVELQPAFDEACEKAPPKYWSPDGVHPTEMGHELIKRLWIEAFEKIK